MTITLAIRNIFRHGTRSVVTLCAIAFGCVALIFVGGFFEDLFHKMRESYIKAHTGHIQIYHRGFFEHGRGNPFDYLIENPDEVIPLVAALPGVTTVMRRLEFAGLISSGENSIACLAQGIEPKHERSVRLSEATGPKQDLPSLGGTVIESGRPLSDPQAYEAIMGRGLAGGINVAAGDSVTLVGRTVDGSINALDLSIAGIFFTSQKAFDDHVLRIPLLVAQELLHTESVQSLVVMLDDTDKTPRVARQLARIFQDRHLDLEIKRWDELSDFYTKTQALFGRMFLVLKVVIVIVVTLSIYNTMSMAVVERTREIGTMMALGTSQHGVLRLFLYEGALLGAVGGLIGLAAGTMLTWLVRTIGIPMPPPPGTTITWYSEPVIVPGMLAFALGLSVVTALVSSWYPARKASRLEVAHALRHIT